MNFKINEVIGSVYDLNTNKLIQEDSVLDFDSVLKTDSTGYINLSIDNKEITLLGDDILVLSDVEKHPDITLFNFNDNINSNIEIPNLQHIDYIV